MRTPALIAMLWLAVRCGPLCGDETGPVPPREEATASSCRGVPLDEPAARALREILAAGFEARTLDPARINRSASSAGPDGQRDSRVEYVRGLVLLKHLDLRQAEAAFLSATESQPPHLPAWQALIRTRLMLKQADAALERAEALARQLADADSGWPAAECRDEAATWLGRVAGFLALDGIDLLESPALLTAHDARIRQAFGERLLAAHERGRREVYRQHQSLLAERARQKDTLETRQQERRAERTQEIEAERDQLEQHAETLQMTAREWQTWLDEQLRRTEKQLEVLQKDYATLDAAARKVSAEILDRQRDLTAFQLQVNQLQSNATTPGHPGLANPFTFGIAQREQQILQLQSQFNALAAKAQNVSGQARKILGERTAAARRFQRATGQLARRDATLQKWEKLLEKQADRNEPEPATGAARYRSLTNRLTLPATYFECDPDAERRRLLEEIGQAR